MRSSQHVQQAYAVPERTSDTAVSYCAAEQHAITAVRAWVGVLTAPEGSEESGAAMDRWWTLFTEMGGRPASHALDQFLAVLALNTRRTIGTGCAKCGRPSADELRVLAYLGAVWHRVDPLADSLIEYWLAPDKRAPAEQFARLYGYAMSRSAIELPPPHPARLKRIQAETLVQSSEIRIERAASRRSNA